VTTFFEQVKKRRSLLLTLLAIIIPLGIIVSAIQRNENPESVVITAQKWSTSAHADVTSRAFTNWGVGSGVIPADCATCHSTHGLLDYVGERGSGPEPVVEDHPVGTTVQCLACHNDSVHQAQAVTFTSGEVIQPIGSEAPCLICHQGRESGDSVQAMILGLDDDEVSDELRYIDAHYHIAAATLMGGEARIAYEYDHASYVGRFEHTQDFQSCSSCHDPHHLRVEPLKCSTCHVYVRDESDLRLIRRTRTDYDGNGSTDEGIVQEIETMHGLLYEAISAYAEEVIGTPIVYSADNFPYFFVDDSDDGEGDPDDGNPTDPYQDWTPRLVRAAYNFQFVQKDPGSYAHNPRYTLQVLYDTLEDLNERVAVNMEPLQRP
jgi:hypothetical protein